MLFIRILINLPDHLQVRPVGGSLPIETLTIGTCSPSASIEEMVGKFPRELTMTMRRNQAEVVFLRLETNWISLPINSSERSQSKNASVFSEGENEGLENKVEKRRDKERSQAMANASRAGKIDGLKVSPYTILLCMKRNSLMLVR